MRFADLQRTVRIAGLGGACLDLWCRAGYKLAKLMIMHVLVLVPATVERAFLEVPAGLEHRFLDEALLRRAADTPGLELSGAFLEDALAKGDRCYGLLDGDRLVSYRWYAGTPTAVTAGLVLHFDRRWYYAYKAFTVPEYRGRRLHAYGSASALSVLADGEHEGFVALVDANNFPSLRSLSRLGYRRLGSIRAVHVAGSWRIHVDGASRAHGLDMAVAATPPAV